jgi:uncharacterized SAM-binding protein YcdF (DUF218 family)
MPVFLDLILALAGAMLRRRWLGLVGIGALWLSSTPLVGDHALRWIEVGYERDLEANAPTAALIVVLSGGRHPGPCRGERVD